MATPWTIASEEIVLNNESESTGLKIQSGTATMELPTVNSSGASIGIPQTIAVTADGAAFTWHPLIGGGSGGNGFSALATYVISAQTTETTYLVSEMAPDIVGPISCRVTMVGSGAGGNGVQGTGSNNQVTCGGGGGGGATAIKVFNGLTPSSQFTVTVPAGGAGGAAGLFLGTSGSPTLVTYGSSIYGANGGFAATLTAYGAGRGGLAASPTGATDAADLYLAGGAGGSGFSLVATVPGLQALPSGFGGSTFLEQSTNLTDIAVNTGVATGRNATAAGGGGSGGFLSSGTNSSAGGGSGAPGMVIFDFFGVQA